MKKIFVFVLFFIPATARTSLLAQVFTRVWETDTLFSKPESAIFDSRTGLIYVSNVNGRYCTKDGNGFISRVSPDGKIIDLKWIDGLNSPQGLALFENQLFVADVDEVVEIDVDQSKVTQVYKAENAVFLNDAAVDTNGCLYISDCKANKIFKLENKSLELWSDNPLLKGVNGLLCAGDSLFALNAGSGTIFTVHCRSLQYREFCTGLKNCDGIVSDGKNGFYVSAGWDGLVWYIDTAANMETVIDLSGQKIITADPGWIPDKKMLLVPTLYKTMMAYKLSGP